MPFPKGRPRPAGHCHPHHDLPHDSRCLRWAHDHDLKDRPPCSKAAKYQKLRQKNISQFMEKHLKDQSQHGYRCPATPAPTGR